MKRPILLLAAMAVMVGLAFVGAPREAELLVLAWARKAPAETPPVAILIELGLKDQKPTDWSGRAAVSAAKVMHREGYRFRKDDKLTAAGGWQGESHRPLRIPVGQPQVTKLEGIAPVGVVLHLAEVKEDARLTLELRETGTAVLPLADVLAGRPQEFFGGRVRVRLVSTATPVTHGKTEDDFPAACYGPDGKLWVAYVSYRLRDPSRRIEQHQYEEQPESFQALYHPGLADQLFVTMYRDGEWCEPVAFTTRNESIARCGIAFDSEGRGFVSYSALRDGKHHVYVRCIRRPLGITSSPIGPEELLSGSDGTALSPVMCTRQQGDVVMAFASSSKSDDRFRTRGVFLTSAGKRGGAFGVKTRGTDEWGHAVAAAPGKGFALARDVYDGDTDVLVNPFPGPADGPTDEAVVAGSSRFEARPSIAYDPKGRLWIAYEEGPEKWGKDFGALVPGKGNPLYSSRSVRVVCLDTDGKLKRPVAELPTSTVEPPTIPFDGVRVYRYEKATRYAYSQIGIDGKGRVWLTYRQNFGSRWTTHPGPYWLTFARRLDGDHWTEPIEVHHSDGLLDSRPVLLPHRSGGLRIIHNSDGRYTTPLRVHNQIYMSYLDLPGEPVEPKLVPHDPGKKDPKLVAQAEAEAKAVQRIRAYRIKTAAKEYRLLRGDFHRHTEISFDGEPDGSLEDMFRYAIDAASLDWIANADHDNGGGREYSWWLTQKFNDAYHVPGAFTPLFSYERSVLYPHGHRNVLFAKRGVLTLPRLAPPEGKPASGDVHPDDAKMLYRYLKELGGICASHTSATIMGTDWRDNDPAVEPVVEIYQGDRMSYEHEDAPRAGYDPKSGKQPANIAGWYPKGFVNHALEKGYRLGFQASSDHWSTHISYFVVLAERNDRDIILNAIKKRHCYAATDNIIVDVRSGSHVMGDELKTAEAPALQLHVIGTGKLAKIDILRDAEVVVTLRPSGEEYRGAWTDPAPRAGTHSYYVRVLQQDGEIAWASPLWITRTP
jgi:hypothetical protein